MSDAERVVRLQKQNETQAQTLAELLEVIRMLTTGWTVGDLEAAREDARRSLARAATPRNGSPTEDR